MSTLYLRKDIPTLTGVRGIAAFWVVFFHLYQTVGGIVHWPNLAKIPPVQCGFLGVDLFFILSGFIMCHVHSQDFTVYTKSEHLRFLMLRLSRIYPLHIVCLLGFLTAVLSLPGFTLAYADHGFTAPEFAATLLMIQNWGLGSGGYWNQPTWSLSAEWLGYIGFPLIVLGIRRFVPAERELFFAFMVLAGTLVVAFAIHAPDFGGMGKFGVVRMAAEFTAGCLIYFSMHRGPAREPSNARFWFALIVIAICISDMRLHWGAVFGLALLIRALAAPGAAGNLLFGNPVSVWLGKISFSLYLSHWPLLQIFNWIIAHHALAWSGNQQRALVTALVIAIVAVAVVLWKFVEVPSRNYLRGFFTKPSLTAPIVGAPA